MAERLTWFGDDSVDAALRGEGAVAPILPLMPARPPDEVDDDYRLLIERSREGVLSPTEYEQVLDGAAPHVQTFAGAVVTEPGRNPTA